MIDPKLTGRGFLPEDDPLVEFPRDSELAAARSAWGETCPACCTRTGFAPRLASFGYPPLPAGDLPLGDLRLYYVRVGFLASAYVNQVGLEPATLAAAQHRSPAVRRLCPARSATDPQL